MRKTQWMVFHGLLSLQLDRSCQKIIIEILKEGLVSAKLSKICRIYVLCVNSIEYRFWIELEVAHIQAFQWRCSQAISNDRSTMYDLRLLLADSVLRARNLAQIYREGHQGHLAAPLVWLLFFCTAVPQCWEEQAERQKEMEIWRSCGANYVRLDDALLMS